MHIDRMKETRDTARAFAAVVAVFLAILFAGFWIPYFSNFPRFDPDITAVDHVHGAVLFAWVLLLLVQPLAVQFRKHQLHRYLGRASIGAMALVLLTSILVLRKEYGEHLAAGMPDYGALRSEYLSATQLALVVTAYLLSINAALRRNIGAHWRWMAFVLVLLLPAGLARTLGYWFDIPQKESQSICMLVNGAVLTTFLLRDRVARRSTLVFSYASSAYAAVAAGWYMLGRPV